ncbi:pyrroloquinoline quinone biosynthesis peptide chaperone PqqD [Vibrio ponticus]|uniref:PqqA binding protein n=1 Tax=Vibrio ponticus TaxID=265668 RepID=A0A3N3DZN3_9VIBR|nr:pyrroloquinoline quinone biosynthesis peptide chaperone PqqD [Vibrio ponticus]ROV59955.1 pyrroloquinoline quinone biosynthesis peptide chaperone PqqD [Vibrio ponticus]
MERTQRIPKMNSLFRFQFEPAQQCHVLLYPEGMVKLNASAAEILIKIDGNNTIEQIHQQLTEQFPEAGDIQNDIIEFLDDAENKRWIYYD